MAMTEKPSREQILSEPGGPRLDAWVAEFVMGMERLPSHQGVPGMPTTFYFNSRRQYIEGSPPRFSTDIAYAWEVFERAFVWGRGVYAVEAVLKADSASANVIQLGGAPDTYRPNRATADTIPLAISRAALLAVLEDE